MQTVQPKKPTLVFVHGFRGSPAGLEIITNKLQTFFNIYVPAIPPADNKDLKKYDIENYCNFIKQYLLDNNIKKPILIGHSMGSIIVAAFTSKYPKLSSHKVILLAPISKRPPKLFAILSPLLVLLPQKLISYITTRFLTIGSTKSQFKLALSLTNQAASVYHQKLDLFKSAIFSTQHSVSDFLSDKKTLIIAGAKDAIVDYQDTLKLFSNENYIVNLYPDAGHLLQIEKPEQVVNDILKFVKDS